MDSTTCWKSLEIEQMRLDFLKGLPIKLIARRLSRSPGAVNKALTRFHIRTPRDLHAWHSRHSFLKRLYQKQETKTPHKLCMASNSNKKSMRKKADVDEKYHQKKYKKWIHFQKVIDWLLSQNISCIQKDDDYYLIQDRLHTPLQVVFFANKKRLEMGLDIFFVENLTW